MWRSKILLKFHLLEYLMYVMCFSFPCAASHWHVLKKHVADLDDPISVIFERCWAWKKQGIFTIGFDPTYCCVCPPPLSVK
jgi:hypothetical protein